MITAAHRHLDGRAYRLVDPDYKSGKETNCSIATWQILTGFLRGEYSAAEALDKAAHAGIPTVEQPAPAVDPEELAP